MSGVFSSFASAWVGSFVSMPPGSRLSPSLRIARMTLHCLPVAKNSALRLQTCKAAPGCQASAVRSPPEQQRRGRNDGGSPPLPATDFSRVVRSTAWIVGLASAYAVGAAHAQAMVEDVKGAAAALASEVLAEQGMSLQDACAQELGVTDLNALIVAACVVEFIALTGAAVGGYLARTRKNEVEKINAQLRQININLRKQARVESYAPALSYAPVGSPAAAAAAAATVLAPPAVPAVPAVSTRKEEVLKVLRAGKQQLRSANPAGAVVEFKKALALAQESNDSVELKKAARGVGASLQRQGKYRDAIKYHLLVLDTSSKCREHSGDTEAYGAIADCYTELGDLEEAAKFYDKYINRLEEEED